MTIFLLQNYPYVIGGMVFKYHTTEVLKNMSIVSFVLQLFLREDQQ